MNSKLLLRIILGIITTFIATIPVSGQGWTWPPFPEPQYAGCWGYEVRADGTYEATDKNQDGNPFTFGFSTFRDKRFQERAAGFQGNVFYRLDTCHGDFLYEVVCMDAREPSTQVYYCPGGTERKRVDIEGLGIRTLCRCVGTAVLYTPAAQLDPALKQQNPLNLGVFGETLKEPEITCSHCGAKVPADSSKNR